MKRKKDRQTGKLAAGRREPARASGWGLGALGSLRRRAWFPGLLLAGLTILVYLPVWRAGFIWDDDVFLTGNALIKRADGLGRFWFTTEVPDYFPLTSTTLWLEWRLGVMLDSPKRLSLAASRALASRS